MLVVIVIVGVIIVVLHLMRFPRVASPYCNGSWGSMDSLFFSLCGGLWWKAGVCSWFVEVPELPHPPAKGEGISAIFD